MDYYHKFVRNYPTVNDLAAASEEQVLKDWQGLGYYSRARNLHASSKIIAHELNSTFPQDYNSILKLKGVGNYTAAAIASIAFDEPVAVVDGNVFRVLSRLFDLDIPIDSTEGKKKFTELANTLLPREEPGLYNQAVMELGALVCTPRNPLCDVCPVSVHCMAKNNNTINDRPVKSKKTKVRKRYFHYLIYSTKNQLVLKKRTGKDIWMNMYDFPNIESTCDKMPEFKRTPELSFGPLKHILSHQHIYAYFYHFNSLPQDHDENWVVVDFDAIEELPIPRLIDIYLSKWLEKD
jgi:A/G-specific adenine glycosylase